jgi:hypothetical protein
MAYFRYLSYPTPHVLASWVVASVLTNSQQSKDIVIYHAMSAPVLLQTINRQVFNRAVKPRNWNSQSTLINYPYLCTRYISRVERNFTTSTQFKMKEAVVAKGPKVTIHDVPTPKPGANQVLIKVIYSGCNPKDWKRVEYGQPHNSGDDIAGIVESVGEGVFEFKKGDRVAAFHEMMAPHGSFSEYAVAWDYTTFHLPQKTSFEQVRLGLYGNWVYLTVSSGCINPSCSDDSCTWSLYTTRPS